MSVEQGFVEQDPSKRAPIDIVKIFIELARWRRFIIGFTLATTVVAGIVSFMLPPWYKSSATLLPPKQSSALSGLGGLSNLLKDFTPIGSKIGSQTQGYNFLTILQSRKAEESLIRHFDLFREYKITNNSMEDALKELENNFDVQVNDDGSMAIIMYDKDSVQAAQMVNYMVQTLNVISFELGTTEARSNREFLERRVNESRDSLKQTEQRMKIFQQQNGIPPLAGDTKSAMAAVGDLYASKVKLEITIALLSKTVSKDNPEYVRSRMEAVEIDKKLATIPEIGMESVRLYRDFVIQQKILEFLVPLFEQARLEEHKDVPVMIVLDGAVPAEKKARPHRGLIIVSAFFSALLLSMIWAICVSQWRRLKIEQSGAIGAIREAFSSRQNRIK